jgi:3-deoxy-D-manno-octulosonic-acid transferase
LKTPAITLYFLLLALIHVLALPFLVLLSRKAKYSESIPARFWLHRNPSFSEAVLWFHGCSLGEIRSLLPLRQAFTCKVAVSAVTQTGFEAARTLSETRRYLPFETLLPFWMGKQKVLVVTEAELWLMLFAVAKRRGTHTVLINARISDRSYKSYRRFRWLYRLIFQHIDAVFAQSEIDKVRLMELGATCVEVVGNIKTAQKPRVTQHYTKPARRVITLASTHEGEEALLLSQMEWSGQEMIVVVPRHPERFEKVDGYLCELAQQKGLQYERFSKKGVVPCDILLCDAIGELNNIYAITDVSVLGGSFVPDVGGHNPLEPAYFNTVLLTGKHVFNQHALFAQVDCAHSISSDALMAHLRQPLPAASVRKQEALAPIIAHINQVLENQ